MPTVDEYLRQKVQEGLTVEQAKQHFKEITGLPKLHRGLANVDIASLVRGKKIQASPSADFMSTEDLPIEQEETYSPPAPPSVQPSPQKPEDPKGEFWASPTPSSSAPRASLFGDTPRLSSPMTADESRKWQIEQAKKLSETTVPVMEGLGDWAGRVPARLGGAALGAVKGAASILSEDAQSLFGEDTPEWLTSEWMIPGEKVPGKTGRLFPGDKLRERASLPLVRLADEFSRTVDERQDESFAINAVKDTRDVVGGLIGLAAFAAGLNPSPEESTGSYVDRLKGAFKAGDETGQGLIGGVAIPLGSLATNPIETARAAPVTTALTLDPLVKKSGAARVLDSKVVRTFVDEFKRRAAKIKDTPVGEQIWRLVADSEHASDPEVRDVARQILDGTLAQAVESRLLKLARSSDEAVPSVRHVDSDFRAPDLTRATITKVSDPDLLKAGAPYEKLAGFSPDLEPLSEDRRTRAVATQAADQALPEMLTSPTFARKVAEAQIDSEFTGLTSQRRAEKIEARILENERALRRAYAGVDRPRPDIAGREGASSSVERAELAALRDEAIQRAEEKWDEARELYADSQQAEQQVALNERARKAFMEKIARDDEENLRHYAHGPMSSWDMKVLHYEAQVRDLIERAKSKKTKEKIRQEDLEIRSDPAQFEEAVRNAWLHHLLEADALGAKKRESLEATGKARDRAAVEAPRQEAKKLQEQAERHLDEAGWRGEQLAEMSPSIPLGLKDAMDAALERIAPRGEEGLIEIPVGVRAEMAKSLARETVKKHEARRLEAQRDRKSSKGDKIVLTEADRNNLTTEQIVGLKKSGFYSEQPSRYTVEALELPRDAWVSKSLDQILTAEGAAHAALHETGFVANSLKALKRNLTAGNLASLINNVASNSIYQWIRSGEVTKPYQIYSTWREYKKYLAGEESSLSDARKRAYREFEVNGLLQTSLPEVELPSSPRAPAFDLADKLKTFGRESLTGEGLARVYQASDGWFKLEEAARQFEALDEYVKMLTPGEWLEVVTDDGSKVKIEKPVGRYSGDLPRVSSASESWRHASLDHVLGSAAKKRATDLFFDYSKVPGVVKSLRASSLTNIVSPFLTYQYKALLHRPFTNTSYWIAPKTNSAKVRALQSERAFQAAYRRALLLQSARGEAQKSGSLEELKETFKYSTAPERVILVSNLTNPTYASWKDASQWNPYGPVLQATRLLTSLIDGTVHDEKDLSSEGYDFFHAPRAELKDGLDTFGLSGSPLLQIFEDAREGRYVGWRQIVHAFAPMLGTTGRAAELLIEDTLPGQVQGNDLTERDLRQWTRVLTGLGWRYALTNEKIARYLDRRRDEIVEDFVGKDDLKFLKELEAQIEKTRQPPTPEQRARAIEISKRRARISGVVGRELGRIAAELRNVTNSLLPRSK